MFFTIPKRPDYVNYEVLCNVFSGKTIDLSEANIYAINNNEISESELRDFLQDQNNYTKKALFEANQNMEKLKQMEHKLSNKSVKVENTKRVVDEIINKPIQKPTSEQTAQSRS